MKKPPLENAKALLFVVSLLVRKRAYLAGPSRTESIAESMPINITHARTAGTQSPTLFDPFSAGCSDPIVSVLFLIPYAPVLVFCSVVKPSHD